MPVRRVENIMITLVEKCRHIFIVIIMYQLLKYQRLLIIQGCQNITVMHNFSVIQCSGKDLYNIIITRYV